MIVRARAPLRLGLAGGGTDVSPYCDIHGGCVLNATIDRYVYATIEDGDGASIHFEAADRGQAHSCPLSPYLDLDGRLDLHKAVYNEIVRTFNHGKPISIRLTTVCDTPAGSGLGSSSTLVVVMLRAFGELLNLPLDDYELARLAFKIERLDCGLQGGRQDQYAATFGGFNFMEFYREERAVINTLRIKNWIVCELEASLLLVYTGVSRESARIIEDQVASVRGGVELAIDNFHQIKAEALSMKENLLKGDFRGIVDSMRGGWESKKRSAPTVVTPRVEAMYRSALSSGALAGKVSGAGGGGYMVFFVPPDKRMEVRRALEGLDGQVSNCHFTSVGTQAWRV